MKAVVVTPGEADTVRVMEMPDADAGAEQVLLRVQEVGVCGTDQEIVDGLYGEGPPGQDVLVLGHENFGQVVTAPAGAGVAAGDYAICMVRRPCSIPCPQCAAGENDMCSSGEYTERGIKGLHGFMSERVVDDPQHFIKVPSELAEVGVLLEPLTVVEKAVRQIEQIQRRMTWRPSEAVVTGAGPIGLMATLLLRSRGYDVYTVDIVPPDSIRAELVRASGAHYVFGEDTSLKELGEQLRGIDVIVEATAVPQLVFQSIDVVGSNGVVCLTGVGAHGRTLQVPADDLNLEMVLENKLVFGTVNANRVDYEAATRDLGEFEDRWPGLCARMITRRAAPEAFRDAFETDKNTDVKATVRFS